MRTAEGRGQMRKFVLLGVAIICGMGAGCDGASRHAEEALPALQAECARVIDAVGDPAMCSEIAIECFAPLELSEADRRNGIEAKYEATLAVRRPEDGQWQSQLLAYQVMNGPEGWRALHQGAQRACAVQ